MQSRYRICIPIQKTTGVVETVAKLCGEWRQMPEEEIKKLEFGHTWTNLSLGEDVESKLTTLKSGFAWALRHRILDPDDAGLNWVTEIGLVSENDRAWLSVSNKIESVDRSIPRPVSRPRTRPRIVVNCIEKLGCLLPLGPRARTLGSDIIALRSHVDELYSPQRHYPLIFVSCVNQTGLAVTKADKLANWLSGVASVVVAQDKFTSLNLAELLPRPLNCWDGAVRIYWPGCRPTDSGMGHRVWAADIVREYDERREFGFPEVVLERVSDLLGHHRSSQQLDWAQMTQLVKESEYRIAIDLAKNSGDSSELLKLFEQSNTELSQQVIELQNEKDDLINELSRAKELSEYWREEFVRVSNQESEMVSDAFESTSVGQSVQWATETFQDQLVFSLNSQSDVDTPFEDPASVSKVFQWLATIYRDAKRGERNCPDLDASIRDSIDAGWFWRGGQAEQTASTYSNWYECNYDGKRHSVREHVGSGKSKKPEQTIRIAFTWLEREQLVLVGFIGQHQKSDKT